MHYNRKTFIAIGILSQPLMWALLQVYQLGVIRPAGHILARALPQFFLTACIPEDKSPFLASSLLSLLLIGICAFVWPNIGFGRAWTPSRFQGLVVLGIIAASAIYPILNSLINYATPARQMGFIIWTITPVQEEILFRGFLYIFALRLFGRTDDASWKETFPVLVVTACWFSFWHLSPPAIAAHGWGIIGPQLMLTFGAGLLFNWLRYWTKSIWLIIPVHAAGNFMISIM